MSVPFFSDFTKATKDFYKSDKYDLGRVVELKGALSDDVKYTAKSNQQGDRFKNKVTLNLNRSFGSIEFVEDFNKGISIEVKVPKFYKQFDLKTKHQNRCVNAKIDYRPKGSYYNVRLDGHYDPDVEGNRLCTTTASVAVGDDSLNLNVGGEITIEDKQLASNSTNIKPQVTTYRLGFLYTPNPDSCYSVIYTPDKNSTGLNYEFSCLKRVENVTLSAKADGRVDTKLSASPPLISLAAGVKNNGNYVQAFFNSRREWGLQYKTSLTGTFGVTLGLSSFLDRAQRANTRLGYKVSLS